MALRLVLLVSLALGAAASGMSDMAMSGSRLAADLEFVSTDGALKVKPITRVVNLLKDMGTELQAEQKADEEMYDKLVCWCETNDKDKTKAIEDGTASIDQLTAAIEENTALASTREVELKALAKDTAELEKALSEAEALRAKEYAEFNKSEKDLIQSIGSLKGAVRALEKTQGGSLIQQEALLQVTQVLRRHSSMAESAVAPHQRAQVRALLRGGARGISLLQRSADFDLPGVPMDADTSSLLQQALSGDGPASGAIFGILGQMKETFETNFESGKKEEAQAVQDYADLKSTKGDELKAANDKTFVKTEELAKAKETIAVSQTSIEDTTNTVTADTSFLANLKTKCGEIDAMWETRQKMRAEEIAGVTDTIAILTDDEARDTMNAAGTFIQRRAESKMNAAAKEKALVSLEASAKHLRSPRLAYLAVRMRNDAFAAVEGAVDGMVGQLGTEQTDEVGKKDGCVQDFNTNEKQATEKTEHNEDVDVEITDLKTEIQVKKEEQDMLKGEIAEAHVELKKASENREEENKIFQQSVSDQVATQAILKKALARLQQVYGKKAAFFQRRQDPPGGFGEYKKASGGGPIALLENIIDESKETEKDALEGENEAQLAYEAFVKESNSAIEAMSNQIVNDEDVKAEDTKKEVDESSDKRATTGEILKLGEMEGTLHEACDFTVNNFSARQKGRADEIEALKQAKAIFHGAKFF